MSNFRITTNGLFRNYRTNLSKNNQKLNQAMIGVETQRKFNSYAEDPAAASKAWRLRRSYWRTNDQIDNNNYIISKYESASAAMHVIVDGDATNDDYGLGLEGILSAIEGISGQSGAARVALGKQLVQSSESMVSMMNTKYGDEYVFAGADGNNIPFAWEGDRLLYRGVDVSTPATDYQTSDFGVTKEMMKMDKPLSAEEYKAEHAGATDAEYEAYQKSYVDGTPYYNSFEDARADYARVEKYNAAKEAYETAHPGYGFEDALKLSDMANETTYVDIGLGMKEDDKGRIIEGSAFNSAVSGLTFLGYGEDNNLAVIVRELGQIFSDADPDTGDYARTTDEARADELLNKLHDAVRNSQSQHVQLEADAKYLKTNVKQLETNRDQLDEQIVDTEDLEMGDAIMNMSWAQYCYNAALRIGTNILSQSLIDYMS